MDLKEQELLGDDVARHWYYRAKAAAVVRQVAGLAPRAIVDIGAGSGFFARTLLQQTSALRATCVDPGYPREWEETVGDKPLGFRRELVETDADLFLLMDVLEHVDDDRALLATWVDRAPRASAFFITVPAFALLWSDHDRFLEHRRRYTLAQLERVVCDAGLQLDAGFYLYATVFPLAALTRLGRRWLSRRENPPRSQLHRHGRWTNRLLGWACAIEAPLARRNRAVGLTACCLARKPA